MFKLQLQMRHGSKKAYGMVENHCMKGVLRNIRQLWLFFVISTMWICGLLGYRYGALFIVGFVHVRKITFQSGWREELEQMLIP